VMVNNFSNINKTNIHLSPQLIWTYKKTMRYDVGNPCPVLVQAHICDGVKPLMGFQTPSS
jgi:hypothetical protein